MQWDNNGSKVIQIAAEARANFEAFIQQTSKKRRQSEGGTYSHKKESNEHKKVTHGSGPIKMAYKGDSTSSKVRKKTTVVQETCALTSEMKAANIAMLVRKASGPDRWRAIIDQSGSSTDEDLLDHKRQDITAENTGTSSNDVRIPLVRILDVGKYVNTPVSFIDRQDIYTNKDGENTTQHTHGGGNPHLLEVFEPKEGNLSTRVGKLEEGHCKGVSGYKVTAERGESPAEELPLSTPNPVGIDVEVEHEKFDVGKYVNRPISSIDREGIKTNKDGENPCEERSCENNLQHTHRGGNDQLLEVSEPQEANLSMSFGKLKENHCQGGRVTSERGGSPAGKTPLSNPNPEDEEVEVDHVNEGGRPAPGEVEEDKDKTEGDMEEAGGSTLIGSLRKNMLG